MSQCIVADLTTAAGPGPELQALALNLDSTAQTVFSKLTMATQAGLEALLSICIPQYRTPRHQLLPAAQSATTTPVRHAIASSATSGIHAVPRIQRDRSLESVDCREYCAAQVDESWQVATVTKSIADRVTEHLRFLKRISTQGTHPPITLETAEKARRIWFTVWSMTGYALPVPAACTGPDGQIGCSWDRGRHHLEIEIIPGQPAEFFYRDREDDDLLWSEEYEPGAPLPQEAVKKLKLFT